MSDNGSKLLTSDAVLAFDMDTGKIAWASQVTPTDVLMAGYGRRAPKEVEDEVPGNLFVAAHKPGAWRPQRVSGSLL